MKLRLEFNAGTKTRADMLCLEAPGGYDAVLNWDEQITYQNPETNAVTQICSGLHWWQQAGAPAWGVLARSRVLGLHFDGEPAVTDIRVFLYDETRNISVPVDAYLDAFPAAINWPAIDRGARTMVRYFNNLGLKTKRSWAGRPGTGQKRFCIEFDTSCVSEDQIRQFMRAHAPKSCDYEGKGWFLSRFIQQRDPDNPAWWRPCTCFCYEAPDLLDALCDLNDWVADDMSGTPGHGAGIEIPNYEKEKQAAHMAVENMDPSTMIQLYNMIQKHRIKDDVETWLRSEKQDPLTPEQVDQAAELYVYQGKYDLGLSHWDNIANIVERVRCGN